VIDDLDRRVLQALRDQPRATMSEQATRAGVSRTTYKARLDRLWESGIIIGHEPQLDLASIGFHVQACVLLSVQQGHLTTLQQHLLSMPQVIEAYATTGEADVQCRVAARDTEHLQETLLELSACEVVTRTRSSVILSSLVN